MRLTTTARILITSSLATVLLPEGRAAEFIGRLSPDPVPGYGGFGVMLGAPAAEEIPALPEPLSPGARVFQGMLRRPFKDVAVALVVPASQPAFLYIDANRNSALEAVERISFRPSDERPELEGIALVRLATNCGRYEEVPVKLQLLKPGSGPSPERRVLAHSGFWSVRGQVRVDDRDILVEYSYPCDTGTVDLANGPFGMDADGNGSIDWHYNSPENATAMNETVVFRVGNHYLSTATVDVSTGRVVLRSHPAADYRRIELTVGSQVPDFSYTDFEGREHHLSDLGERYVLLDFWFAACGPCIAGIPNLKEARERYQSHGFEVLSLTNDDEEELDKARRVVADKNVDWPQAAGPMVRDLVNQRFRIRFNPNYVLLDPSRKIVSTGGEGELPLQGEALLKTLGSFFPSIDMVFPGCQSELNLPRR